MTLQYAEPEPFKSSRNPWTRTALAFGRVAFQVFGTLIAVGLICGASYVVGGTFGSWYAFLVGIVLLGAAARVRVSLHRGRVANVLACCARGMRLNLPLDVFLRSAAQSETGALRRRLSSIARRLSAGLRPERAIVDSLPELDARQARLLTHAGDAGALREELDRLYEEHIGPRRWRSDPGVTVAYLSVGMFGAVAVATMLAVFVVPKYQQIMRDCGLPSLESPLFALAPALAALGIPAAIAILVYVERSLAMLTRFRGTAPGVQLWQRFVPIFGRASRDLALADFYLAAARAAESGQPLSSLALTLLPNRPGVTRLTAESLVQDLRSPSHPKSAASLPAADLAVLSSARGPDGLARALRFLAEARLRTRDLARRYAAGLLSILAMLVITALVCELFRVLFGPLLTMMDHLSDVALRGRK